MTSSHNSVIHSTLTPSHPADLKAAIQHIDDQLSKRDLELDPAGYFIVFVDREQQLICTKFFTTVINDQGLATDPLTGEVIPARGKVSRSAERLFTGHTAKELCVQLFETEVGVVSQLSHAAYLGRELQKAEAALVSGTEYVQD
ncbi:MAG: DUF4346 domain-containing protein [Synechococcaceae cyanobacterium SM2_3_2]|nr:DUF4346 domain-containing protein [Synechococcaceae cyanobacterium SM2_3_2]